ncbi:MAG: hypothetical protein JWQ71_2431 [Pedosphaera sp.]|nr:hypothetical protein [Pedosphaera sp.]
MKRRRLILIIVAALLLGGLAFYLSRPKEPSYQDKTLTEWLRKLDKEIRPLPVVDPNAPELADSVKAIRSIGTNGIPTLLKLLNAKDFPAATLAERVAQRIGCTPFQILHAEEKRELANWGFMVLGAQAHCAVPALIQFIKRAPADSKGWAISCLSGVKPDKELLLPILTQSMDDSDYHVARVAATTIHICYPEEAEKAGVYKMLPHLRRFNKDIVSTNVPIAK